MNDGGDRFSAERREQAVVLEPGRSALLVIDMLNDFCKPGGAMVLPGAERLYPMQQRLLAGARRAGAAVIYVNDRHRAGIAGDREFLKRTPHCLAGSWGAAVVSELAPQPGDHEVVKHRYSGFFETDLDLTLKDLGRDQLVVMGVVTNICVRSTVHDAFFRGYSVVVPEDAVAATGPREQASSLYDIATHFGTVGTAEAVLASWQAGALIPNRVIEP